MYHWKRCEIVCLTDEPSLWSQAQQEELRRRTFRRTLFVEQGERVAQRYPGSADEISWRVNYLNNKWDQLESTFTPAKGRNQEVEVELGEHYGNYW